MVERRADVLLIGGGAASHACAVALRDRGFDGSIVLVGRELDPPYDRPPCSKELVRGEIERNALALPIPDGVDVLSRTSVLKLDPAARIARLSTKEEIAYGDVLVATGANVRRLGVDGSQWNGIHYLRAPGNAEAIRRDADAGWGDEVVVVGGSYLGTEMAASLTLMGKRVTVLMQESSPLERSFGPAVGGWVQRLLEARGVRFLGSDELAGFEGDDEERVSGVRTAAGRLLPARMVVVCAGAVPDVTLARSSGLPIGATGGVRCEADLRIVGTEGAWAAGDACEWDSPLHGGPARVEHWEVARAQGRTVAAGICGEPAPHVEVPYFWSDVGTWATLEYVGVGGRWDAEEVRGSSDDGAFSVLFRRDGRLVGVLAVGRSADLDAGRAEIASIA